MPIEAGMNQSGMGARRGIHLTPGERRLLRRAVSAAWRARCRTSAEVAVGDVECPDATRVRSHRILSGLIEDGCERPVDLGLFVGRCASLVQSSGGVSALHTSLPRLKVDRVLACGVAVLVADLVLACEGAAGPAVPRVYVAAGIEGSDLVLGVACPEAAAGPVLAGVSAAAYVRASNLSILLGGPLVRGVRDGLALFGATLRWPGLGQASVQ